MFFDDYIYVVTVHDSLDGGILMPRQRYELPVILMALIVILRRHYDSLPAVEVRTFAVKMQLCRAGNIVGLPIFMYTRLHFPVCLPEQYLILHQTSFR